MKYGLYAIGYIVVIYFVLGFIGFLKRIDQAIRELERGDEKQ